VVYGTLSEKGDYPSLDLWGRLSSLGGTIAPKRDSAMRHWTYWEWVAYVCLFVAAMIIAADTGFRISPDLATHLPAFVSGWIWGFAPLALVILATIFLLAHEFRSKRPTATPTQATTPPNSPASFEVSDQSQLIGQGTTITGNIGRFARLSGGSVMNMSGATITGMTGPQAVRPPTAFPPSTREFSSLSNEALLQRTSQISREILQLSYTELNLVDLQRNYMSRYAHDVRSLVGEFINRLKSINVTSASEYNGGMFILYGYLPDQSAANDMAAFLRTISESLRNLK
jgi:hypothetical protein